MDEIGRGGVSDVHGGVAPQIEQVVYAVDPKEAMVLDLGSELGEKLLLEVEFDEGTRRHGKAQHAGQDDNS